ncbi:CBS domain-containing protein [Pseudonocardia sp. EV170527-09]|uniref:CBS domain-containing protein n=1 Tax=Pseudonocardia sp. EV170527-09 TaxID=2603411 RepID=UPI0011F116BA|nr:CBS domain-containing protein [Pseudonocardia sp. EV170527-09]KAA1034255.1 CBS domain-containing protein [Pseudonocardia sp. EV170527-09]
MVVRARDVMTERVVTIWADAPLARAQERMAESRFSALPVVDRRFSLVGVISLVDVLRHRDDPHAVVGDAMTEQVVSVLPTTSVSIVARRMRVYGELRLVPVVDKGVLVGVITRSDLLRHRHSGGRLRRTARRIGGVLPVAPLPEAMAPRGAGRVGGRPTSSLRVSDVMTDGGLVAIPPELALDETAEVLLSYRFTAVPVVDDRDHLLGIVSEADLMHGSLDGGRRLRARTVSEVMTRDVETVQPDDPLTDAEDLLSRRGFRVVPVVDADDVLVGVLSRSDLL